MKKEKIYQFNQYVVEADRDFLKLIIDYNKIDLIHERGIQSLLDDVKKYLDLPLEADVTINTFKPVLVLSTLCDSLKELWYNNVNFTNQIKAMNTGEYQYGRPSPSGENNFKDFEFEIFTASLLTYHKMNAVLPQDLANNDIICEGVEIQCKHPNSINRNKIDKYLRDFNKSLIEKDSYGIFGIGLDDVFEFTEEYNYANDDEFIKERQEILHLDDQKLIQIFDDTLRFTSRILGVYTINTHFVFTPKIGLIFIKTGNSIFCLRKDYKIITEIIFKKAYKILTVFNEKPFIRKLDKDK